MDALLALGRRQEALAELETLGPDRLAQMPRGAELRVLEAELHAERGACDRAMPLFDEALSRPSGASVEERALFGRASCRVRLGEPDGAAADLRRYLEHHPTGRHAESARRMLDRIGPE